MKFRLTIQQKIQFFIISSTLVIYLVAIGLISFRAKNKAYEDALQKADLNVQVAASDIKSLLNADLKVPHTLAKAFQTYKDLPEEEWKLLFSEMYYQVFKSNPQLHSIWDSWELSMIDPNWTKPYGRYKTTCMFKNGEVDINYEMASMNGDSEAYARVKRNTTETIVEPYIDNDIMMTSVTSPIFYGGRFIGVVGIDITLERLQSIIEEIKPFSGSYAFLLSNEGKIVGHPNKEYLNNNVAELFPKSTKTHKLIRKIREGINESFVQENEEGVQTYFSYAPITIGETQTPWAVALAVPLSTIMEEANYSFMLSLITGIVGLILMTVIISIISYTITNPIKKITHLLSKLSQGVIDDSMYINLKTGDEIAEMGDALNISVAGLIAKKEFANNIGNGELETGLQLLSDRDSLGQSLENMRQSLLSAKQEEEVRSLDDEKRRWANEGVALFGDILRSHSSNINKLSNEIIKNLVTYLKANQGGLFIYNDEDTEDTYYELLAAFAFNRKKYLKQNIKLGEGLVGTCAIEKESIYITEIPEEYIQITSGLGDAPPKALLLVPLKLEEDILGVIEIASFSEFTEFELEFVEKIAENIASTLQSVRVNHRTTILLETSQQQAEEMAAQEEEMRQNMEELQATQEEAARKAVEMDGFMKALNASSFMVQYQPDGKIIEVNDNYLNFLGLHREEVVGTHHSEKIEFTPQQIKTYNRFWSELRGGEIKQQKVEVIVNGKKYHFKETYTPIEDEDGQITKIVKLSYESICD